MKKCKITVLKRTLHADLADEHIAMAVTPCEAFAEGQEFVFTPMMERPQGFCDWAWNDIYKVVIALARGGNFSDGMFQDWMKETKSMITCCTDGIRPVIFKVEIFDDGRTSAVLP
ncbi:MAG TPA: TIGR04076 family protein [bacterium]|mgnify:FL=1|nr:TIGR04076 family protein [bacterium]HQI48332.1 TIGR04076 family protein [bacterium]HQJ64175.1 TIGR04076 family protein [bacterium]